MSICGLIFSIKVDNRVEFLQISRWNERIVWEYREYENVNVKQISKYNEI